jgi:hypothetical protein
MHADRPFERARYYNGMEMGDRKPISKCIGLRGGIYGYLSKYSCKVLHQDWTTSQRRISMYFKVDSDSADC